MAGKDLPEDRPLQPETKKPIEPKVPMPPPVSIPTTMCGMPLVRMIGSGSYARVYVVCDGKEEKALKVPFNPDLTYEEKGVDSLLEINILTTLSHPHLLHADRLVYHPDCGVGILLPLASCNLEQYIRQNHPSFEKRVDIFFKVCCATRFLLQHHILHLDLKPQNILIDNNGEPLLSDFGMAIITDDIRIPTRCRRPMITVYSRPLENLQGSSKYNQSSVVWQLGIVFMFLMTEMYPDIDFCTTDTSGKETSLLPVPKTEAVNVAGWLRKYCCNDKQRLHTFETLCRTFDYGADNIRKVAELGASILNLERLSRPSIDTILNHSLFRTSGRSRVVIEGKVVLPPSFKKIDCPMSVERLLLQFRLSPYSKNTPAAVIFAAIDLMYRTVALVEEYCTGSQEELAKDRIVHNVTCHYMAWKLYEMYLQPDVVFLTQRANRSPFLLSNPYADTITDKEIRDMEIRILVYTMGHIYHESAYSACTNTADAVRLLNEIVPYPERYREAMLAKSESSASTAKPTMRELLDRWVPRL